MSTWIRPARPPRRAIPLTPRQREIFEIYFAWTLRDGFQPSNREVMEALAIKSPNGIACHLRGLVAKGWMAGSENRSRALRFLRCPDGSQFLGFRPIQPGEEGGTRE